MVTYKKEKKSHYGYTNTTFGHSTQPNQNKKNIFYCWNFESSLEMSNSNQQFGQPYFCEQNWLTNPHVGYFKPTYLASICEAKFDLAKGLDAKFLDEVECE
jgi:hypothetical protein